MRQLDFDYGTTVPIIIFIYHDPLTQSIRVSLYATVFLSGIILENNLYSGVDWTSIQIVCVTIPSAGITSSRNGPERSYGLRGHRGAMPSWGTEVCLAFPARYVVPRRSPCPAPCPTTSPGPQSTRDIHALSRTRHAPFRPPLSLEFPVQPPQPSFTLALANLPAMAPAGWAILGQPRPAVVVPGSPLPALGPPLQLLQSPPFAFLPKSQSRLYVKAFMKLITKGNMYKQTTAYIA